MQALIEKIQKLRALATKTTNVNEAAAAAAAADKLIQEHNLSEAEIGAVGNVPEEKPEEDQTIRWQGSVPAWQMRLASGLARHYGCASVIHPGHKFETMTGVKGRTPSLYSLIGRRSDIETVHYMYSWLSLEINDLAKRKIGGKAFLNSFRMGAVAGVLEAMGASKRKVERQAKDEGKSTALAVVSSRLEASLGKRAEIYPKLSSRGYGGSVSHGSAFESGRQVGRNIHTGKAMGAGSARGLLRG